MLSNSKVRTAAKEADDETFKHVLADAVHNHKFSQAPQFQLVAHIDLGDDSLTGNRAAERGFVEDHPEFQPAGAEPALSLLAQHD